MKQLKHWITSSLYHVIPKHMIVVLFLGTAMSAVAELNEETSARIYDYFDLILTRVDDEPLLTHFAIADVDGDGEDDVVLTDLAREHYKTFLSSDLTLPSRGYFDPIKDETHYFMPMHDLFRFLDLPNDFIHRQRPLFVTNADKEHNRFDVFVEEDNTFAPVPLSDYTRMMFKPHVNAVRYVDHETFSLTDPSVIAKMFRGYGSGEIAPVVCTPAFLEAHTPQQFSRWKSPEPIKKLTGGYLDIVREYFGAERIIDSRWLATIDLPEVGGTHFYDVLMVVDDTPMCVLVRLAEGTVASWMGYEGEMEDGKYLWYGDTDYWDHMHEIMAITFTGEAIHLFVRWNSMEGTHYTVFREKGNSLQSVLDDYEYWYYGADDEQ